MKLLAFLTLFFLSINSMSFELASGAICDRNKANKTMEQRESGVIISEVYKASNIDSAICIGWTNMDLGSIWYDFTKDMVINVINTHSRTYLGNWRLTRWQYEFLNQQYLNDYSRVGLMDASKAFPIRILSEYQREDNIGCLANTPLRYGDVEQDGKNELVLTTGEDLIVFSPGYERIVFMQRYNSLGWLSKEKSDLYLTENIDTSRTEEPQYLSRIGAITIEDYQFITPGIRGYAKVFEGDFDEDDYSDILLWAKTYRSNMKGGTEGFTIIENKFIHYERDLEAQEKSDSGITGEYLPQETAEATIQSWLSGNELTWSKGYPSISECEGEEGALIPEMHDALLNDPDVLQ